MSNSNDTVRYFALTYNYWGMSESIEQAMRNANLRLEASAFQMQCDMLELLCDDDETGDTSYVQSRCDTVREDVSGPVTIAGDRNPQGWQPFDIIVVPPHWALTNIHEIDGSPSFAYEGSGEPGKPPKEWQRLHVCVATLETHTPLKFFKTQDAMFEFYNAA